MTAPHRNRSSARHRAARSALAATRFAAALFPTALLPAALFTAALFAAPLRAQERSIDIYYGDQPEEYQVAITGPDVVESPAYAFRCARIIPVTSAPIEDGVILTRNGRILAFGPADEVAIPDGFEVVDLGATWCAPGLVELHCHVAARGFDLNDVVHQTNPELRTWDLVTMEHDSMRDALAGGVTTVLYIPGSGSNMGGFGTLTKTWGRNPEEALIRFPGCLKIAQAGNPERRAGDLGVGPLGMNEGLRATFERGRDYHLAWERYHAGDGPKPERQPGLEYLRGLFRHEYPVGVHTQIFQVAMQTIRQLRGEFGLWTVIIHGTFDAYRLSGLAAERGVPIANGPRQYHFDRGAGWGSGSGMESSFVGLANAWYAGGEHGWRSPVRGVGIDGIAVNTDSPVVAQEELSLQCAMAVRLGLPEAVAIRAVTINPARFVRIEDRVGSLEVGKDADLGFWHGDPLDPRSWVEATVVNGNIAYRRDPERPRF